MRIHFKNLGHAERYLKACKEVLSENLTAGGDDARLPTQRIRNAFCKGFGYSSYDELKRLLSNSQKSPTPFAERNVLLECLAKGFTLALEVATEYGFAPVSVPSGRFGFAQMMARLTGLSGQAGEFPTALAHDVLLRVDVADIDPRPRNLAEKVASKGFELLDLASELVGTSAPRKEEYSKAAAAFQEAIQIDPTYADAFNGIAGIQFELGNYPDAQKYAETALALARQELQTDAPSAFTWWGDLNTRPYMRARHNLGLCMWRQGNLSGAITEFREILRRNKNDNQGVRFLLGCLYHQAGDLQKALPAYKRYAGTDEFSAEPGLEYSYALALYESKNYPDSVLRLRYAFFQNFHIAQMLLSMPAQRLNMFYGTNHAWPEWARDYVKDFGALWKGKPGALSFLKRTFLHPSVKREIEQHIDLRKRLNKRPQTQADFTARRPLVEQSSTLESLQRIKETNEPIVKDVTMQD